MNSATTTGAPGIPTLGQASDKPIPLTPGQPDLFMLVSVWLELDFPGRDSTRPACRAEPTIGGAR